MWSMEELVRTIDELQQRINQIMVRL